MNRIAITIGDNTWHLTNVPQSVVNLLDEALINANPSTFKQFEVVDEIGSRYIIDGVAIDLNPSRK